MALLVLSACVGPTPATAKTKTFSSGNINRAIPDPSPTVGFEIAPSIAIKRKGKVKDVNYAVRISHTDARDLEIGASHIPSAGGGRFIGLKEHEFLSDPLGADFGAGAPGCEGATFTVFDSQAPTPISLGSAPFAGTYSPTEPLTVFNGMQLRGRWYLDLLDTNTGDAGVLNCWQITIRYKPPKKRNKS